MAQTIETSNYLSIKFPLTRNGEETSRTLNFPFPIELAGTIQTELNRIITKYSTIHSGSPDFPGYQYLVQPTNWRDTDETEEAWQCDWTKITAELVQTTKTGFVIGG